MGQAEPLARAKRKLPATKRTVAGQWLHIVQNALSTCQKPPISTRIYAAAIQRTWTRQHFVRRLGAKIGRIAERPDFFQFHNSLSHVLSDHSRSSWEVCGFWGLMKMLIIRACYPSLDHSRPPVTRSCGRCKARNLQEIDSVQRYSTLPHCDHLWQERRACCRPAVACDILVRGPRAEGPSALALLILIHTGHGV